MFHPRASSDSAQVLYLVIEIWDAGTNSRVPVLHDIYHSSNGIRRYAYHTYLKLQTHGTLALEDLEGPSIVTEGQAVTGTLCDGL